MLVLFLYKKEKSSLKGTDQNCIILPKSPLVAKFTQINIKMSSDPRNNPMGYPKSSQPSRPQGNSNGGSSSNPKNNPMGYPKPRSQ